MDPKEIKLTTTQKIVPLLKAINDEVPWQMVLVCGIALVTGFFGGGALGIIFPDSPMFDFILRRFLIGFLFAIVGFLVSGFTIMTIEDKIIPLFRRISDHYEKHSLVQKKKVLDSVIEDEVLHK